MSHPAELEEAALLRECTVRRTRGSGPGGQHRNKVETAIVIEHIPSGIRAEASERRSQEANRQMAFERLRVALAIGVRTERSAAVVPSPLWQARRSGNKIQVSAAHADYPSLLAEALDVIAQHSFAMPAAAEQLGCSTSQLVKLLQKEPAALTHVNRERHRLALHPLK